MTYPLPPEPPPAEDSEPDDEPSGPGGVWDGPCISYEEDPTQYYDPPDHAP